MTKKTTDQQTNDLESPELIESSEIIESPELIESS